MEIKNVDRLIKKLTRVSNVDLRKPISEATLIVEAQAKALAPVDTGNLKGSIHPDVQVKGKKVIGRVYSALEYALYVEFGTGAKGNGTYPYAIEGFNLTYRDGAWCYSPDGGKTFIYTKGQEAQPFMYPALQLNKDKIKRKINESMKDTLKKSLGG